MPKRSRNVIQTSFKGPQTKVAICAVAALFLVGAGFNDARGGMFDKFVQDLKSIGASDEAGVRPDQANENRQKEIFGGFLKCLDAIGKGIEKQLQSSVAGSNSSGIFGDVFSTALNTQLGPMDLDVLGRELTARMLGKYKTLPPHHPLTAYVRKIVFSLVRHSRFPTHHGGYTVIILDDNQYIGAFSAPGGIVSISTGMVNFLKLEDELASILGHELAHQKLEHGLNSIKDAESQRLFKSTTNKLFKSPAGLELEKLFGPLMQHMENGYGSDMEAEAGQRGMEIAKATGYDPAALVAAIERLKIAVNNKSAKYPPDRALLARRSLSALGTIDRGKKTFRTRRILRATASLK